MSGRVATSSAVLPSLPIRNVWLRCSTKSGLLGVSRVLTPTNKADFCAETGCPKHASNKARKVTLEMDDERIFICAISAYTEK
jgi:hypothetical protein